MLSKRDLPSPSITVRISNSNVGRSDDGDVIRVATPTSVATSLVSFSVGTLVDDDEPMVAICLSQQSIIVSGQSTILNLATQQHTCQDMTSMNVSER
jgi:hypothetical protein